MTREELLEDIKIGDIIDLYIETEAPSRGKVISIGDTSLKLEILGANTFKRISYSKIHEYDVVPNDDADSEVLQNKDIDVKEPAADNKNISGTKISINRDNLFERTDYHLDTKELTKIYRQKLSNDEKSEYSNIENSLKHIIKIREYNINNPRVMQKISELSTLAERNRSFNVFIGCIYQDINDEKKAREYFEKAGEYDACFKASITLGDDEHAFEFALKAFHKDNKNEAAIQWLCSHAVRKNDISVIKYLIGASEEFKGKIALYWYADSDVLKKIPCPDDIMSEQNISYLCNAILQNTASTQPIEKIIESIKNTDIEKPASHENTDLNGNISYYDTMKHIGTIKSSDGRKIPFYISQVKDIELQKMLSEYRGDSKLNVNFSLGINYRGETAADAITLSAAQNQNDAVFSSETYTGYTEYYDIENSYGTINSGGKTYSFIFSSIIDPLLRAKINSEYTASELDVKFNLKKITDKNNKEKEVACNIISNFEHSKENIDYYIRYKFITKQEADKWLGKETAQNSTYFHEVPYTALKPIGTIVQSNNNTPVKKTVDSSTREYEKKAISLIVPEGMDNPFANLPKISSKNEFFQSAHKYMVGQKTTGGEIIGINLEKAEELFIKAIQANDQTASAIANLANIYIKLGGEHIAKGLLLLDTYDYLLPDEKLSNLRIQLIDKSGDHEALELILKAYIPKCSKVTTRLQYTVKLAGVYLKKQEWEKAIDEYSEALDYMNKHITFFPQHESQQNYIYRTMIIAYYNIDTKKAKSEAKKLQSTNRAMKDDPIINSILNDSFSQEENQKYMEDFEEMDLQYEDEYLGTEQTNISGYLSQKLKDTDIAPEFGNISTVYNNIKNGVFTGNADEAKKAIKDIQENLRKNRRSLTPNYRSSIYLGVAKIIMDSRDSAKSNDNNKLSIKEVKKYVARSAKYTADSWVQKNSDIDSIRFMYIQALKYLVKRDQGNISSAFNMLVNTFFMDNEALTNALHNMKGNYDYSCFEKSCRSIKDFIISTFMLKDKPEYVKNILSNAYENYELRKEIVDFMNSISGHSCAADIDYDEFKKLWNSAENKYYGNLEIISREIKNSVESFNMKESIQTIIQNIKDKMEERLLWNRDEYILTEYLKIIETIDSTYSKYTNEEKIEGFKGVIDDAAKLMSDIKESPTEFSFDNVYANLSDLDFFIKNKLNEIYSSSKPDCDITLSNNSIYIDRNEVKIQISFRNANNKQDAEAVEINLEASHGAKEIKCERKFTSIRSGEEQEYIAIFNLNDNIIREKQFDVHITMKYRYHKSIDGIETDSTVVTLPVNITSKEEFVPINNRYEGIVRASGIDPKTPELFKGRNELIDNLCASLCHGGKMTKNRGIVLWGQRRVGKNSVQNYLRAKIEDEYPDAYIVINIGSIGKCRNLKDILITIVSCSEQALLNQNNDLYSKLVKSGIDFDISKLEESESYMSLFSAFMIQFSSKLKELSEPEKNIPLYFLDEFTYLYQWIEEGFLDGKMFMQFWKSFIQDYGICAIIIGQDNIPIWKSKFENEFACMNHKEITYLNAEGARELICEPCRVGEKELFTNDAVDLIYNLTKGSAFLIVIFCNNIIKYLNNNYTEKATKTIVKLVLEKDFIDNKGMFESSDFEPQIQDVAYVGEKAKNINYLNEKLLKEIAAATINDSRVEIDKLDFMKSTDHETAQDIFKRLKERKIIEVENNKYCSIDMPLLKLYLLREQSLLTKEKLEKLIR